MGAVYRAEHTALPRTVALKLLDSLDAELRTRFRREAEAAGRLAAHPNVVGVHDVGEDGERLYLAMDVVEGPTLEALIAQDDLAAPAAAALLAQAARAVAHAHANGLIHRDLKPANILVQPAPDGPGLARVADFGLAASTAAGPELTRLTQADAIVGTPAYMSPEQAQGDPCDGRTDVWALGACLYHALAGRPPFPGETMLGILTAVMADDPAPFPAHVPAPLAAIALRCLAKSPDGRYDRAADVAADLERFLAGEPVQAHRPVWSRVGTRRWRTGWAVAGGAAVLAALGGAVWWAQAGEAEQRGTIGTVSAATDAATAAGDAERALYALHAASHTAMRTLESAWHGRRLDDAARRDALAAVAAAAAGPPAGSALPATWTALAQVYAGAPDAAQRLADLERAAGHDPFPSLLAARMYFAAYVVEARLPPVVLQPFGLEQSPFAETDAMASLRQKGERALERAARTAWWRHLQQGRGAMPFAEGARALGRGQFAAAAAALARVGDDPLFGDDARFLRGMAEYLAGDHAAAAAAWERAGDGAWPDALRNAATARLTLAAFRRMRGEDPGPELQATLQLLGRALAADPRSAVALADRGLARTTLAERPAAAGADPDAPYRAALADFDAALQIDPALHPARVNRGNTCRARAQAAARRGDHDAAAAAFDEALDDHRAVTQAVPGSVDAWNGIGLTHLERGEWLAQRGLDPVRHYQDAQAAFDRVLASHPEQFHAHANRAQAALSLGRWSTRHGTDPTVALTAAVSGFRAALARHEYHRMHIGVAAALEELARWDLRRGGAGPAAARPRIDAALVAAGKAALLVPGDALPHSQRARLLDARALAADRAGTGGTNDRRAAVDAYSQAIALDPAAPLNYLNRGALRAQLASRGGADAGELFAAAIADFGAVLERQPRHARALLNRGMTHRGRAAFVFRTGGDPAPHLQRAQQDFTDARALNPRLWEADYALGVLYEGTRNFAAAATAFGEAARKAPGRSDAAARAQRCAAQARGGR